MSLSTGVIDYLATCSPEEMKEVVSKFTQEQKSELVQQLCARVNQVCTTVLENKEQIWEDR